jgi:predicted RNase H-like HicB family nuclease
MVYIAYLHKDEKSDFGVSFPDFPGCITAGRTLPEARRMSAEALTLHIKGMVEDGDRIPRPSTLEDIKDDPDWKDAALIQVSVNLGKTKPPKTWRVKRVNITVPEFQLKKIDRRAEQADLSRSAYIVQSATKELVINRKSGTRGFVLDRQRSSKKDA